MRMKTTTIYINQQGYCELGQGETLEDAIENARDCGCNLTANEIKTDCESITDGDVYWVKTPVIGYQNDLLGQNSSHRLSK